MSLCPKFNLQSRVKLLQLSFFVYTRAGMCFFLVILVLFIMKQKDSTQILETKKVKKHFMQKGDNYYFNQMPIKVFREV